MEDKWTASRQSTHYSVEAPTYTGAKHGGPGGSLSEIIFEQGEIIEQMYGKTNNVLVDQVSFDMQLKSYGPYGKTGRTPFSVKGLVVGLLAALETFWIQLELSTFEQ